jgi:hypothetical protein
MREDTYRRYDFDILKLVLEEMGYCVYLKTESELKARRFPFHFKFSLTSGRTVVNYHLDMNAATGEHITKRKNTSRDLKSEYRSIVKKYILSRSSSRNTHTSCICRIK